MATLLTNFDNNLVSIAQGSPALQSSSYSSSGSQVSLKTVIVNFHQYLLEFVQQQKDLSGAFPSMCNLTGDSFQKLTNLIEQSNFILSSSKRYESLPVNQRINLFNKQKEWIQRAEYLKKIQLSQHFGKSKKSDIQQIQNAPLDSQLYSEFITQKKIEQLNIQRENLMRKFFLKKQQEEALKKQAAESQKVRRVLPEAPEFEEDQPEQQAEEVDMHFENFNYVPMNEKQYEDNSSSSFFDSNSTGLSESPIRSSQSTASYKQISNFYSSKFEVVSNSNNNNNVSVKSANSNSNNNKKQQLVDSSAPVDAQLQNKFLQKKYLKLEESTLNLIEKLALPSQAASQIFRVAREMMLAILNDKEFFKNKTFEIISEALVLLASKLSNYPITIKAITQIVSDKERCINKVYSQLVNALPQFKSVQFADPELLIQEIISLLNVPQEILYASQYLFQNLCVNGLLKGEQSAIVSSSVVFISSLLNGINFPLDQYSAALQINAEHLQNYSNFILSNSKILINNPALFKQSNQLSY